jgi:hypothetical protein
MAVGVSCSLVVLSRDPFQNVKYFSSWFSNPDPFNEHWSATKKNVCSAGILEYSIISIGDKSRVGIRLSYRPARLLGCGIYSWAPEKFKNTVSGMGGHEASWPSPRLEPAHRTGRSTGHRLYQTFLADKRFFYLLRFSISLGYWSIENRKRKMESISNSKSVARDIFVE